MRGRKTKYIFFLIDLYFFVSFPVPPRIHHISSGGHMQVKKGASVRIECSASGMLFFFLFIFEYLHIIRLHIIISLIESTHTHTHIQLFYYLFSFTGNPSPNITWTKKFENLPNGKIVLFFLPANIIFFLLCMAIIEINRYFVPGWNHGTRAEKWKLAT